MSSFHLVSKTSTIPLRPMQHSDLELVIKWRNHPDIRRFMYTQHEITLEEHTHWFEQARQDLHRHLLLFEKNGIAQGFINIQQLNHGIADWGFYLAPEVRRGTGSALGAAALAYIFQKLKLHKVCGEALGFNEKSIRFHRQLGFTQEGILRQQHFDGKQYQDIYRFGLLASEWETKS